MPNIRFSADDDDVLINFVQRHSILYNLKDIEFKNNLKKDMIWNEAGKVLNREGEFINFMFFEYHIVVIPETTQIGFLAKDT